ncbi:MAG: hypothetical protein MZU97_09285 [Bacillus subtilis]|nr:hypothetical protein [Bacillus subtilis]
MKIQSLKPLKYATELIANGANPTYIFEQCYESKPMPMVRLHARAIDQAIFVENNKIAYTKISRAMLDSLNATDDHIDGITEDLRQINTVEVSMVFKETSKGDTKVSFRSNRIDVCEITDFSEAEGINLPPGVL